MPILLYNIDINKIVISNNDAEIYTDKENSYNDYFDGSDDYDEEILF